MEKKFLLPGEFHVTRKPMNLVTVLGSCVSLCLYKQNAWSRGYESLCFSKWR